MWLARKTERDEADSESVGTPAGVSVARWDTARRPAGTLEHELHERTIRWLATLPRRVRPLATGSKFPRVVNRICDLWSQCEYTRLYLQSLLIERRADRRGFPPEIRQELETLQQYYFEHLSGLPAVLWNAVPLHPPRIPDAVFAPIPDSSIIDIEPPKSSF